MVLKCSKVLLHLSSPYISPQKKKNLLQSEKDLRSKAKDKVRFNPNKRRTSANKTASGFVLSPIVSISLPYQITHENHASSRDPPVSLLTANSRYNRMCNLTKKNIYKMY